MSAPRATKETSLKELTLRGIIIGGIITLVFTAANVYLGLKVGLTFATSIPAAVISMAVLRFWGDHTVQENNIIQTIASAAGTLSAVIFVLPGLVIVGWWSDFPYWQTMFVCAVGGSLGVMYSIPLRRALVTGSDLPYPEGVAGAEILKVGDSKEAGEDNKRGLLAITWGALASAAMALFGYLKVTASEVGAAFKIGSTGTMISTSLSLALIGVGHLVGMTVGVAMLIGMLTSYGVLLPLYASGQLEGAKDLTAALSTVFKTDVRFIGAGVMAVAAIWTLIKIMGPIVRGMSESLRASRGAKKNGAQIYRTEQDIPGKWVIVSIFVAMVPIAGLLWWFMRGTQIEHNTAVLIAVSVLFILLAGLLVAAVCGYMAGLIGSSNSPVSGVGLLVVVITAVVILAVHGRGSTTEENTALIAYTLFTSAIVFCIATIANDNLQDLKTGQLVGATPWKQQVALVIGVVFGSLIIPPVLELMQNSFGFQGAPDAGPDPLAAPQASLISSLAKGVLGGGIDWKLLGIGAAIGVVIIIDEVLRPASKGKLALPPLAVGMGIYLPASLTILIPIGGLIGFLYNRWADKQADAERAKRFGTLAATGLIVGESLFGVVYAGIAGATGSESPLALPFIGEDFTPVANVLGIVFFAGATWLLYGFARKITRDADRESVANDGAQSVQG